MTLRILLDEHVNPAVADTARRMNPELTVVSVHDWENGHFCGAPDRELLLSASAQGLTLLTFDLRTIPTVLRSFAEEDIHHGGVVFVDEKSLPQNDVGGIARTLCRLAQTHGNVSWVNRVQYLKVSSGSATS